MVTGTCVRDQTIIVVVVVVGRYSKEKDSQEDPVEEREIKRSQNNGSCFSSSSEKRV